MSVNTKWRTNNCIQGFNLRLPVENDCEIYFSLFYSFIYVSEAQNMAIASSAEG